MTKIKVGQVWRRGSSGEESVVVIAVKKDNKRIIICGFPDIVAHEIETSDLTKNFKIDLKY